MNDVFSNLHLAEKRKRDLSIRESIHIDERQLFLILSFSFIDFELVLLLVFLGSESVTLC